MAVLEDTTAGSYEQITKELGLRGGEEFDPTVLTDRYGLDSYAASYWVADQVEAGNLYLGFRAKLYCTYKELPKESTFKDVVEHKQLMAGSRFPNQKELQRMLGLTKDEAQARIAEYEDLGWIKRKSEHPASPRLVQREGIRHQQ